MKELVAQELSARVRDGDLIAVGAGSTVELAVRKIGERIAAERLTVYAVPGSLQTGWQCEQAGFKVLDHSFGGEVPWGFDGADAVNDKLWLIKGRGGALLQEKILAAKCRRLVILVDESKLVRDFAGCAIPVEVIPAAVAVVKRELAKVGALDVKLRAAVGKCGPIITEAGNVIFDVTFPAVDAALEGRIKSIVGVVENGLFIDYADEVLVGGASGLRILK